jgi:hypothetical protein
MGGKIYWEKIERSIINKKVIRINAESGVRYQIGISYGIKIIRGIDIYLADGTDLD